jgi:FlaA1/EpsC-like NDP-sugar epimerase
MARLIWEHLSSVRPFNTEPLRDGVVLGAGISGHMIVKMFLSQRRLGYRPVAVLDDSEHLIGSLVHGVKVMGDLSSLRDVLIRNPRISAVVVAIPTLSADRFAMIEEVCLEFEVPLKRIQSFDDIACIDAREQEEGLTPDRLLRKDSIVEHESEIRNALFGKRVLVTGAGGSIGSEIVRQVGAFNPSSIVMVDSGEFNLYTIERDMRKRCPDIPCTAVLASVVDKGRINRVFQSEKPDFVFHAAAYKHVPLLEINPYEAFVNNVVGTRNVLAAAVAANVSKLVMVSTDKAVDPESIMGCSKRISEFLVQSFDAEAANFGAAIVRFGNVINSAGSVIPLFRQQILSGGPVTVTHPDMMRFFMSISEAVRLVLTAGTLGREGEIYILDMGKPIRIVDVARKMLALYGRRDIPIVFTGIRPGEKLFEELTDRGELLLPSQFKKVYRSRHAFPRSIDVGNWVSQMERRIPEMGSDEIAEHMRSFTAKALLTVESVPANPSSDTAALVA